MSAPQPDLLELFRQAALEITGKQFAELTWDTPISDLGISSMDSMEIIGKIEGALDRRVPDEALMDIRTVRDLARMLDAAPVP